MAGIAKTLGKPLAVEKLDFGKDRLDTNKKFNRMAANFPFKKIIGAVMRRAFKEGVGVKPVWPAHTSTIGYWKYMQQYGVIIHHAAALVIARRAIGFKERISNKRLIICPTLPLGPGRKRLRSGRKGTGCAGG